MERRWEQRIQEKRGKTGGKESEQLEAKARREQKVSERRNTERERANHKRGKKGLEILRKREYAEVRSEEKGVPGRVAAQERGKIKKTKKERSTRKVVAR